MTETNRATSPAVSTATDGGDGAPESSARGRVLLVHRFYAPDVTTYAQMLRVIAAHLRAESFDVEVFSTQPSYNDAYDGPPVARQTDEDGVAVRRVRIPGGGTSQGRLLGGLLFGALLMIHGLRNRGRYDVISVSTVPPVAMGLFGVVAARLAGARLVYHCMDLYPELATASGSGGGLVETVARRLDMITVRHASKVVVLSTDMAATLAGRGHHNRNVVVLNNFIVQDGVAAVELPEEFSRRTDRTFRVIFAGNLGRFQDLETVLAGFLLAARQEPRMELCLLGAGVMEPELRALAGPELDRSVRFWAHRPLPVAMAAIADADLALVSLAPGLIGSAYPSKTLTYLEMGTRILAVVEPESSLARLVVEHEVGAVAPVGDVDGVAAALLAEARRQPDEVASGDRGARAIAEQLFSRAVVLPMWSRLFDDVVEERRASVVDQMQSEDQMKRVTQ